MQNIDICFSQQCCKYQERPTQTYKHSLQQLFLKQQHRPISGLTRFHPRCPQFSPPACVCVSQSSPSPPLSTFFSPSELFLSSSAVFPNKRHRLKGRAEENLPFTKHHVCCEANRPENTNASLLRLIRGSSDAKPHTHTGRLSIRLKKMSTV